LEPNHYKVFEAENGEMGTREAVAKRPDVIILELCLPDIDGLTVLKRLREWNCIPVLILSADAEEERKVAALDSGASDYMEKPFGASELLARLRVVQRSIPGEAEGPFYINGDLQVDVIARRATVRGCKIEFTPTEEALFYTLVRHSGQLVTCKHLVRCIWGTDLDSKVHDLHVYIRNLRQKLRSATDEMLIQTDDSMGYRLVVPFEPAKQRQSIDSQPANVSA